MRVFLGGLFLLLLAGCAMPAPEAVPSQAILMVNYPAALRAGEVGQVTLTLEGETESFARLHESYNLVAEARLELPGVQIQPLETVSEPFLPGQQPVFFWSIRPQADGKYQGQLWFYLRLIPKDGGPEIRQALSAQKVSLEVASLFGLDVSTAGWLGVLGLALSAGLGAPLWWVGLKQILLRLAKRS